MDSNDKVYGGHVGVHNKECNYNPNEKCKELRISFARNQPELQLIVVNGQELEVVHSAKLLGVAITSGLSWNDHIDKVLKKASKCLYFLVQLKRA